MFQIFACKQTYGIAAVFAFLTKCNDKNTASPICPSCTLFLETKEHILTQPEEGRAKALIIA